MSAKANVTTSTNQTISVDMARSAASPTSGLQELLDRQYVGGASVTNCVVHLGQPITERPDNCRLCRADVTNTLRRAVSVNEWLNKWKDDATKFLEAIERG